MITTIRKCKYCEKELSGRNKVFCNHKCMGKSYVTREISKETRKKLSKAIAGRILTKVWKERIGNAIRGRKESDETRKKKSVAMMGKNYKGGPTTSKVEKNYIRKSVEYKLWRESIFKRDNYQCQMPSCDSNEKYVEAHHIKPFAIYKDDRYETSNGITLCRKCHNHIARRELEFINLFNKILCH